MTDDAGLLRSGALQPVAWRPRPCGREPRGGAVRQNAARENGVPHTHGGGRAAAPQCGLHEAQVRAFVVKSTCARVCVCVWKTLTPRGRPGGGRRLLRSLQSQYLGAARAEVLAEALSNCPALAELWSEARRGAPLRGLKSLAHS